MVDHPYNVLIFSLMGAVYHTNLWTKELENEHYSPSINFGAILLVISRHVVKTNMTVITQ